MKLFAFAIETKTRQETLRYFPFKTLGCQNVYFPSYSSPIMTCTKLLYSNKQIKLRRDTQTNFGNKNVANSSYECLNTNSIRYVRTDDNITKL